MVKVRVKYQEGIFVPLEKVNLKEGEVIDISIERKFSELFSEFKGIVRFDKTVNLNEAYYEYVNERTNIH
jgi:predicted DNA-binding antitoxin AbrB/MazE fold protein